MWSIVQTGSINNQGAPSSRSKHAMCSTQTGMIYLLGGRSANLPLKDFWRFDPVQSLWEELRCRGNRPPCLQEHTMVGWRHFLYVFGGEIGFASTGETPLWILDTGVGTWRKHHIRGLSGQQPSGRRGHTSVVYNGAMHIYGGYQDLRGSSSELWSFDFVTERWHLTLLSSHVDQPPARHNHSSVVHDAAMWVYGGMTDLQERNDFWKWDFGSVKTMESYSLTERSGRTSWSFRCQSHVLHVYFWGWESRCPVKWIVEVSFCNRDLGAPSARRSYTQSEMSSRSSDRTLPPYLGRQNPCLGD